MFEGIPVGMQSFMVELRNRNSKPWYEAHKPEYQRLVKEPFGALTLELGEAVRKIDDRILIEPRRCVSRARRDTRFTHDKSLYRQNVWISYKPAVDRWDIPSFFFEVLPDHFQYGLAFLDMSPAYLRKFRDYIADCPNDFKKAVQEAQAGGLSVVGECYKKPKEGAPRGLEEWYSYKRFYLAAKRYDTDILQTRDFIPDVIKAFESAAHFYEIFTEVADSKPGEFSYEEYGF
ncbi:MAG: DUF2461 domain-containing protein [Clostridia bacterium]|nr:DUF2461 domain-containing protein [Clostridia bacterium]